MSDAEAATVSVDPLTGRSSVSVAVSVALNDAVVEPRFSALISARMLPESVMLTLCKVPSDGSNRLLPGLATAWDVAPDGKSVTLKLRSDVGFHDGTPFDAEAVKFTFDTIADPKTASEAAVTQLGPYAGSEVIDPHTVCVKYSQPFGAALASYAEGTLSPVSPAAVKRMGNQAFSRAPVGTGPFKFVSWEEGRQVVLERFDN